MRVFISHTMPDPIVHDVALAAEDLSIALIASREALMPIFEILERIEDDEQLKGTLTQHRARAANNQLHIVDERMHDHSDMAYAIHEKVGAETPAQPMTVADFKAKWIDPETPASVSTIKRHTDRIRWREAVEDCERELEVAAKMKNASDEETSLQGDRTAAAYHRMLALRAPTSQEARRKLRIMREWECGSPSDLAWNSIMDDMEALTATA